MSSFSHFLYEKVKQYSDLYALKIDEQKISYSELLNKSLNIASIITELKSHRNETIGIIGQRNLSSFALFRNRLGTLFQ